jgi:hypothetical protein
LSVDQMLQLVQIGVSVLTLGGVAFALGRVFERIALMQRDTAEIKGALFGTEAKEGIFLRRSEADLMQTNATQQHLEIDRRFAELGQRFSAFELRPPVD